MMYRTLAAASIWAALAVPGAAIDVLKPAGAQLFNMQDSCKPENRKASADKILVPAFEQYAGRVKEVFADLPGPAMLTIGDGHSNSLFFNFLAHVNKTSVEQKLNSVVVNVALDQLGLQACEAQQKKLAAAKTRGFLKKLLRKPPSAGPTLHCVTLEGWLPAELFHRANQAGTKGTGTCSYNIIIWSKPHILKAAVQAAQYPVLMIDTDVVVKKDIMAEGEARLNLKKQASIVTGIENHDATHINTGTVFVPKTRNAMPILDAWIQSDSDYLNDDHGDQAALQAVFNINHRLSQYAVTFGEAVGQCSRPAEVAIHYNCYANKLAPMTKQGDWDLAAQSEREKLGLYKDAGFDAMSESVQRRIEAIETAGEWLELEDPDASEKQE